MKRGKESYLVLKYRLYPEFGKGTPPFLSYIHSNCTDLWNKLVEESRSSVDRMHREMANSAVKDEWARLTGEIDRLTKEHDEMLELFREVKKKDGDAVRKGRKKSSDVDHGAYKERLNALTRQHRDLSYERHKLLINTLKEQYGKAWVQHFFDPYGLQKGFDLCDGDGEQVKKDFTTSWEKFFFGPGGEPRFRSWKIANVCIYRRVGGKKRFIDLLYGDKVDGFSFESIEDLDKVLSDRDQYSQRQFKKRLRTVLNVEIMNKQSEKGPPKKEGQKYGMYPLETAKKEVIRFGTSLGYDRIPPLDVGIRELKLVGKRNRWDASVEWSLIITVDDFDVYYDNEPEYDYALVPFKSSNEFPAALFLVNEDGTLGPVLPEEMQPGIDTDNVVERLIYAQTIQSGKVPEGEEDGFFYSTQGIDGLLNSTKDSIEHLVKRLKTLLSSNGFVAPELEGLCSRFGLLRASGLWRLMGEVGRAVGNEQFESLLPLLEEIEHPLRKARKRYVRLQRERSALQRKATLSRDDGYHKFAVHQLLPYARSVALPGKGMKLDRLVRKDDFPFGAKKSFQTHNKNSRQLAPSRFFDIVRRSCVRAGVPVVEYKETPMAGEKLVVAQTS